METIVIDGNITVTVVGIDRGKVRLAISAPREVPVHRQEIQERIEAKRRELDHQELGAPVG
jgi:carbon storage regulator